MVVQDETRGLQYNTSVPSDNGVVLDGNVQPGTGEGHVAKIRKPYTITKQRERWTEEEHKKFLEALKLYGRAWRKIEEHVGTKTAVQIRSHAQKFFSKVVRESSSNTTSVDPIEIPPPRPKRKPMHPYPRKLAPLRKDSKAEHGARSASPHSSLSEQERRSPTSILSVVISETLGCADSTTPNCSPSEFMACEISTPKDDVHQSHSSPEDLISVKLELFPNIDAFDKEDSDGTKVLKLFGKDVVVVPIIPSYHHLCCTANQVEKPTPLPWWVFFRGMSTLLGTHHEKTQEKETQRDGSCVGSDSGSVNDNGDGDAEVQSVGCTSSQVKKTAMFERRGKGFVPYKRCLFERDMQSSTITSEEKASQRLRLCL